MTIRVLIIKPGFGGGKDSTKYRMLQNDDTFHVTMPDIPEPTRGEKVDIKTGINVLQNSIQSDLKPDVIVAGSRGNIYVLELIQRNIITTEMPIFCIGALKTRELCTVNNGMQLLLLCHGTLDDRNSIDRVRVDCTTSKIAELVEFHNDSHSLPTLEQEENGRFLPLLHRLYHRSTNAAIYQKWIDIHRPEWISSQIEPKIREYNDQAREAKEKIYHRVGQNATMASLLNAIQRSKVED